MRERGIRFPDALHGAAGDVVGQEHARIEGIDHRVHEPLRPLPDHAVLGVGADAVRQGGVLLRLHDHVVLHLDAVDNGLADCPERRQFLLARSRVAVVDDLHDHRIADVGQPRQRRADVQLVGEAGRPFGVELEDVAGLFHRPHDIPGEHVTVERMQLVLEFRDHAEVAAAAADRPEQVGFLVRRNPADAAVGGDDAGAGDIVDGQPVFAIQPAEAAAERVAAAARVRDDPGGGHQAFLEARRVEVVEQGAALCASPPRVRIRRDGIHLRQVDHQAALANRFAGPAVAAAAHRQEQVVVTRETDGIADVFRAQAPRDERRAFVVHAVPDHARRVVLRVSGEHYGPRQRVAELPDGRLAEFDVRAVQRYGGNTGIGLGGDGRFLAAGGQKCRGDAGRDRGPAELTSVHYFSPIFLERIQ